MSSNSLYASKHLCSLQPSPNDDEQSQTKIFSRSSSREAGIRVQFFLQPILVGEQGKRALLGDLVKHAKNKDVMWSAEAPETRGTLLCWLPLTGNTRSPVERLE